MKRCIYYPGGKTNVEQMVLNARMYDVFDDRFNYLYDCRFCIKYGNIEFRPSRDKIRAFDNGKELKWKYDMMLNETWLSELVKQIKIDFHEK